MPRQNVTVLGKGCTAMCDKQKVIDCLRRSEFEVEESCRKGKLDVARQRCDEALKEYRKARIEFTSNISDRSEREKALLMSQAYVTRIVGRLLRAYGEQSDVENALTLYRDALEDFKTATHKETREAALSFMQAAYGGVFDLVEYAKTFGVDEQFEEGGFLEQIACLCYGTIIAGSCLVRQYEESESWEKRLRFRMEAAEQMNPTKAFAMFVKSYKTLGKIYEDEGLQESALSFQEIDDVWRLSAEVRKLAEKYRDKTLRQQFLSSIATTLSESILYYGRSGKSDAARAAYEELKNIVEEHEKNDNELVYAKAKGAANLIYMLVNTEQPDEARAVYEELRKLAEAQYPVKKNLLVWQAGGRASEIIYAYAKANKFDDAMAVYEELRKLAEDYRDEAKLLAWQANGAFYLTYEYFKAGMSDEARSMFQQLEKLAEYADDELGQQKKDGMPLIDWLKQLLQKGNLVEPEELTELTQEITAENEASLRE